MEKIQLTKQLKIFCYDWFNSNGFQEDNILLEQIIIEFYNEDPRNFEHTSEFIVNLSKYIKKLKSDFLQEKGKIYGSNNLLPKSVQNSKTLLIDNFENLSVIDLYVLLSFFPEKSTPKAKKLFLEKTNLSRSAFYEHRYKCLKKGYLKVIDPGSPSLLQAQKEVIFIISKSLGISPKEFIIPINFSEYSNSDFSENEFRPRKMTKTRIKIRTHRIRVRIPISCDKSYYYSMMSAYETWIINKPKFNPDFYHTKEDISILENSSSNQFSFSVQFFRTNIAIFLHEVWGIDAYDNMEIIMERIRSVLNFLKVKFPRFTFEMDSNKWNYPNKKFLLDHTEHSIPGHALAEVANFLKTPPNKFKDHEGKIRIGWDNSMGPEFEVFRTDFGPEDINQEFFDTIWRMENRITVKLIYEFLLTNSNKCNSLEKRQSDLTLKIGKIENSAIEHLNLINKHDESIGILAKNEDRTIKYIKRIDENFINLQKQISELKKPFYVKLYRRFFPNHI